MRNGFGALKHTAANREHTAKPRKAHCDACGALLNGSSAKPECERCGHRFAAAAQQQQESESEDTKMSDSMSQADEDDGDSETSEDDSGGNSSTSLSSGERNAPVYSSGGTPSTNLKHRITHKAQLQKHETITDKGDSFAKVPTRPMMELQAGTNVWYQAYVLKESKNEVKVRFPAIEPSDEEKVEWVRKGSSRIWTGSYHSNQWRHLGKGAWAPRAKPKSSSRRLGGRVRRKTQSQGGGGQQHRRRKVSGENSALQTEQSTRTTPANGKDDESQQQENEIMSPAPAAKQQRQQQEKGSYSQNAGPAAGPDAVGAHVDDGHRENSSKRMSSDENHAHNKGSGVQGDQVSAKSNPSDFDGFFHSDHEDAEEQERLTDTAEYDPLAKWFEFHFTQLQAAGTLAAQLPGSNLEAGSLPPGFAYNPSSRQIVQAQCPAKRPASSRQEAVEGRGGTAAEGQEAGGSGSEEHKAGKRPCQDGPGSDDSKPGTSAGGSAEHQHRSSRGAYAGLRELQGLSMWGWDHADHSTHDLVEIPTKRLRGHHPPSNLQPSSSLPTALPPAADSPPTTSTSLPHPPPPPAADPPITHPPPPPTTLSRHQSSNSSKPPPTGPPVPPPPDTGTLPAAAPSAPPRSHPDPPPKPEPAAKPPPERPTRPQASKPSKPRKRALIVSSDESDGEPDPPAARPPPPPKPKPKQPQPPPPPKPKQSPPAKPPSKLPPLPSALPLQHDPNNLQPSPATALQAKGSDASRPGSSKAAANGGPGRQQRPTNGAVVLSSTPRTSDGAAAAGPVNGLGAGGQRGPQGKAAKAPAGAGGSTSGKPQPPSRMGAAGQKLRS